MWLLENTGFQLLIALYLGRLDFNQVMRFCCSPAFSILKDAAKAKAEEAKHAKQVARKKPASSTTCKKKPAASVDEDVKISEACP